MEQSPNIKKTENDRSIVNIVIEKFDEAFFMDLDPNSTQPPAILTRTGPDGQGINSVTLNYEDDNCDSAKYVVLRGLNSVDMQEQAQPSDNRQMLFTIHRSKGVDKTIPYFADNDSIVVIYSDGHIETDSDEFKGSDGAERILNEISLAKIVR